VSRLLGNEQAVFFEATRAIWPSASFLLFIPRLRVAASPFSNPMMFMESLMSVPLNSESRLLKVVEAAAYLGVSAWHVRRLVWGGDLPAVRMGAVRLDRTDLDKFIDEQKFRNGIAGK